MVAIGGVVTLFLSGLVIYFIGCLVSIKERGARDRWIENQHRARAGLPPLRSHWPSRRGCLWSMVVIPTVILLVADWLSEVWR